MIIFGRQQPSRIGPQSPQPQSPQPQRPQPRKPQPPPASKSFFEEKGQWRKNVVKRRFRQGSHLIPGTGGRHYRPHEIDKILDDRFPWGTHRDYISKEGTIRELKKMRAEENRAPTSEKKRELKRQRSFLEQGFELKGKY